MGIPAQPEGDQLCFHCGIRPHQRILLHLPIIHMGSFPIKVGKGENGGCLEQSSRRFLYAIRCVSVLQGHFVFLFLIIRAFLDSLQGSR